MKETDLRIGNLVYDREGSVIEWDSSIWYWMEECVIDFEDFKPIKLTEDWLLRFGFEAVNHKGINGYLSGNCDFIYNIESKQMFSFNEVNGDVWNLTRIIYVHQLQNLYHALTGEELKIK